MFNYITGDLNAADDATLVTKFENINEHCRWFNGQEFLLNDHSEWPKEYSINQWRTHQLALTE